MKRLQPWFSLVGRVILGGVLFAAGFLKYEHLDKSRMAVRAYEILPISIANFLGIALPFLEIAIGLLLVLGAAIRIASLVGGALMVVFIIGISQAWARGLSIDCGCFGGGGQVAPGTANYLPEILRDTALAAIAIYLFRYPRSKFALDRHTADEDEKNG
jgi:uncharacterized membrane protein YphA (DoxX/SURF4 family)